MDANQSLGPFFCSSVIPWTAGEPSIPSDHNPILSTENSFYAIIAPEIGARDVSGVPDVCKVSLVGVGMRSHANVAARMFKVLADENVNIRMISTTEIKISIVVENKYLELAVRALHDEFDLDEEPKKVESELTPTEEQ